MKRRIAFHPPRAPLRNGTGGFVAAYLLTQAGFPNVILALIIGMVVAAIVGWLIGMLALRRTGIYFAMM